jgi:hypothetical protein
MILLIYKVIMTSLRDLKAFYRHYYYYNDILSGFFPTAFGFICQNLTTLPEGMK